jgi:tight adherence protein B
MNVAAVTLLVCVLVAAAAACVVHATMPARADRTSRQPTVPTERLVVAAVAAFVVLLATRWVGAAAAAAALAVGWDRLFHDHRADDERRKIDAIAKWLEDLRDTLRGSSIGAEEALEHVAERPPEAIREPLATFLYRRRQGFRTDDALTDLADALQHPTADAAVAAIQLVVSGTAGAGRLFHTVSALAAAARDEVRARERVDRTRSVYQRSMKRLVIIAVVLVAYLRIAGGDLLDAYATPAGQVFLLVPLAMWIGCVLWLRSLCRYDVPTRTRPAVGSAVGSAA